MLNLKTRCGDGFIVQNKCHQTERCLRTLPALNPSNNEQYFRIQPAPLYTPLKSVCNSEASASKDESGRRPDGRTDIETLAAALHSCPHQLWTILDLDSHKWAHFSRFTLRVSWPAFVCFISELSAPPRRTHDLCSILQISML